MAEVKPVKVKNGLLCLAEEGDVLSTTHGGTGASSQADALTSLLPDQTSAEGKALISDGETVLWGEVAADAGNKADKSTKINAGTGLTGGGDLSANRTISVDFGTGADQAVKGNDPRLADGKNDRVEKQDIINRSGSDQTDWAPTDVALANEVGFVGDLFWQHDEVRIKEIATVGEDWVGGCLALNGNIYAVPSDGTKILKVDPATDEIEQFGELPTSSAKWNAAVLAPNGKVYGVPYNSTTVLAVDVDEETTATFGSVAGTAKYSDGILGYDGKIYCIPWDATNVLVINPANDTVTTLGSGLTGSGKWGAGVRAPNGKIYGIPYNSTTILEIDPAAGTVTTFGDVGEGKYYTGAEERGKIFCPAEEGDTLVIDYDEKTIEKMPRTNGKIVGGIVTPTNKVYGLGTDGKLVSIDVGWRNMDASLDIHDYIFGVEIWEEPEPEVPELPGAEFGGGFYAGNIKVDGKTYALVISPKEGESATNLTWKTANTLTTGAMSTNDGWQNTLDLIAAGAAAHPAAKFCRDLNIGGFDDWYLPSCDELEMLYRAFKPTTQANNTHTSAYLPHSTKQNGFNPNSDPAGAAYTSSVPAQTSDVRFQAGGAQAFRTTSGSNYYYWSSTQYDASTARSQSFRNGNQTYHTKTNTTLAVRAVRRVLIE